MSMRYPGGLIASTPVTANYPSGVWTQAQAAPYQAQNVWTRDQFWPYTTLLLQGDGAVNGAQNNTFLDSSSNNFTITRNGNTTQGSFTPYEQDGYWSNFFGGSSYFSCGASSAFDITSGDFTVEAWVFRTSGGAEQYLFSNRTNSPSSAGWEWRINATDFMSFFFTGGSIVTGSTAVPVNTWTHLAVTRQTNTVRLFVNGVLDTSATFSNGTSASSTGLYVGYGTTGGGYLTGYMSNARLVKGTAVYTSAFTPPAAPLTAITNTSLLTCQSNRFKDNSTNNFTLTIYGTSVQAFQPFPGATTWSASVLGGSGYFDGSGDNLTSPDNAAFTFGTGDLTVEGWFYSTNNGFRWAGQGNSTATATTVSFYLGRIGANFYPSFSLASGSTYYDCGGTGPSRVENNTWNHIAGVRDGTTMRVYLNGVQQGTLNIGTVSINDSSNLPTVGRAGDWEDNPLQGYCTGFRIVKGTCLYPNGTTFTPPAPPTAVSGTSLLLNMTNAGIFDAAAMNDLETVGNAQVSTSVVKYGTGSMAFDGTDDRLTAPASVNMAFGSGDFTVEGWFYTGTPSSNRGLFQISGTAGGLQADNLNNTAVYCNSSVLGAYYGGTFKAGTTPIAANTWTHFALVRNNSVTRLYVNGVLDSGFGSNLDTQNYTGQNLCVGGYFSTSYLWNGYIDDLRITKGAARYITNFTPPIARLPAQ